MGKERIPRKPLGDFVVVVVLCIFTSQQGYWLFAFLPGSWQTHTGSLVFCLRAPPSRRGALQILQIPSSRHM